mmetsp:Transcript_21661/g.47235  ORF Transcript_21661/g.47235 Transcript_21661/m.47235 type:complete len:242 (+) Transcript_21661:99-824(+)
MFQWLLSNFFSFVVGFGSAIGLIVKFRLSLCSLFGYSVARTAETNASRQEEQQQQNDNYNALVEEYEQLQRENDDLYNDLQREQEAMQKKDKRIKFLEREKKSLELLFTDEYDERTQSNSRHTDGARTPTRRAHHRPTNRERSAYPQDTRVQTEREELVEPIEPVTETLEPRIRRRSGALVVDNLATSAAASPAPTGTSTRPNLSNQEEKARKLAQGEQRARMWANRRKENRRKAKKVPTE